MTTGSTGTKRRTLLQRGLALLAGGAAVAGGTQWLRAASPPAAALPSTLTLYARRRQVAAPPGTAGHPHAADGRIVASGELLDGPDGRRVGSFHTNCFCQASPFGPQAIGASSLEFHVLQLADGTLFGIGSGSDDGGALAIVGGTNRYAGRSGTYIQRAIAGGSRGDDIRELIVTFAG
ncbi:MAG: hypothetical protein ABI665_23515 [Vicinamibacterales bacterium]